MDAGQLGWQHWKSKPLIIWKKIPQDGILPNSRSRKTHKHISVNIDIIFTNILIQIQTQQWRGGGINHT